VGMGQSLENVGEFFLAHILIDIDISFICQSTPVKRNGFASLKEWPFWAE
jgi:hypothetical protein